MESARPSSDGTPAPNLDIAPYWNQALPLGDFLADLHAHVPREDDPYGQYIAINQQRARRVAKTLTLREEVAAALARVQPGTRWLILNEHWCGDGAQILPVLAAMAQAAEGRLEARALFRDANLPLMDQFLTHGGRSIPLVILLGPDGAVVGRWGPRPEAAMALVRELKSHPETAANYGEGLHKWYAENRQADIQTSVVAALEAAGLLAAPR
jgi:hypothetical protein